MPEAAIMMGRVGRPVLRRRQVMAWGAMAGVPECFGQTAPRIIRLCWIGTSPPKAQSYSRAFLQQLAERGFVEGRNLQLEFRTTLGLTDLAGFAADLSRLNCDAYFAPGTEAGLKAVNGRVGDRPILIVANDYDPVATGHVSSMARPGGRVTGVSQLQLELPAKRLQTLRELLPNARRIGVLADSSTTGQLAVTAQAARQLGLTLVTHEFAGLPYDYDAAFAAFTTGRVDALVVLTSGYFVPQRQQICDKALAARLPSMFNNGLWVEAGGLMSYGPDFAVSYRRAAEMLVRVLQGADPATMPIEQPNAVEMALNLKTAKVLGLIIPTRLRLRAEKIFD